jgi:hypothetical protein
LQSTIDSLRSVSGYSSFIILMQLSLQFAAQQDTLIQQALLYSLHGQHIRILSCTAHSQCIHSCNLDYVVLGCRSEGDTLSRKAGDLEATVRKLRSSVKDLETERDKLQVS